MSSEGYQSEVYEKLSEFVKSNELITKEIVISEDGDGTLDFDTEEQAIIFTNIIGLGEESIVAYEGDTDTEREPEVFVVIPNSTIAEYIFEILAVHLSIVSIDIE